jgi:hypothetical protein
LPPRGQCGLSGGNADGLGKIVGAPHWYDQRRNLFGGEAREMSMNGPVTAEDQHGVRPISRIKLIAAEDVDAGMLERSYIVLTGMRSQEGNGAHRVTFAQDQAESKPPGD